LLYANIYRVRCPLCKVYFIVLASFKLAVYIRSLCDTVRLCISQQGAVRPNNIKLQYNSLLLYNIARMYACMNVCMYLFEPYYLYFVLFCVSDIYLMKADLDSRNMLQCTRIIKLYLTRSIFIIIIIIITAFELSLGGSSTYTSTSKTNKNK
jgi:hypothetical protein